MINKEQLKDYLKPITNGLFGKQKAMFQVPEAEKVSVRPVGMIVEDLCDIPPRDWAKYAFSREPLNGKFQDEQRYALTEQALACGVEYAERYAKLYGTENPRILAGKMGLTVEYPLMPQNTERVLFAEFREPNHIYIYMDGVKKAEVLLDEPGVRKRLSGKLEISNLLMAHELFHYIEEQNKKEIWTLNYKIDLWAPKPLKNRSSVVTLSEIAAMGFAQRLTGLAYSPYVMDAFMVYGYAPMAASALYEEMMQFAGRTPRLPAEAGEQPALDGR